MTHSTFHFLLLCGLIAGFSVSTVLAQAPRNPKDPLPRITVHSGGHYLETADGQPFFWLGDTAWELIHHTTREEASYYIHTRRQQGFTVIQTVVLSEFNGISEPKQAVTEFHIVFKPGL